MKTEEELEKMSMLELLELKEFYRTKHGLHIENNMDERGSFNHKTKPYWGCTFKKRMKHPKKKGRNYNAHIVYQTFDSYREALIFCLSWADNVLENLKGEKYKDV